MIELLPMKPAELLVQAKATGIFPEAEYELHAHVRPVLVDYKVVPGCGALFLYVTHRARRYEVHSQVTKAENVAEVCRLILARHNKQGEGR